MVQRGSGSSQYGGSTAFASAAKADAKAVGKKIYRKMVFFRDGFTVHGTSAGAAKAFRKQAAVNKSGADLICTCCGQPSSKVPWAEHNESVDPPIPCGDGCLTCLDGYVGEMRHERSWPEPFEKYRTCGKYKSKVDNMALDRRKNGRRFWGHGLRRIVRIGKMVYRTVQVGTSKGTQKDTRGFINVGAK